MAIPRPLLKVGAAVFLLVMAGYSTALIYYNRHRFPTATLGLTGVFVDSDGAMRVDRVESAGAAERAGLRTGDHIVAVNGQPLTTIYPFWNAIERGQPGAVVRLEVRRPGDSRARDVPVTLDAFRLPTVLIETPLTATKIAALNVLSFYPVPFLVVAGVVLMQRPYDRHAWLLAVMFGGFIAGVELPQLVPVIHPALRKPLLAYWALFAAIPPAALYCFFANFPEPTSLDRRVPWLKWILLGPPLVGGAFLAIATLLSPGRPFYLSPDGLTPARNSAFGFALGIYSALGYGLGLASLIWNAFRARPETRRRTRVMLWGTAGALLPVIALGTFAAIRGVDVITLPFWSWVGAILALFLLPLSFAYAVVKHRVMEIPVLLRRSARYVVVHHAIITVGIVIGLALTFVFAWALSRVLPDDPAATMSAGPLSGVSGAVFGIIVALATRRGVRKATERLDRAFFREAYDARQLLQDLARRTRAAIDRQQLATLLEGSLTAALHPSSILVLLRSSTDRLELVAPSAGASSCRASTRMLSITRPSPGRE